MRPSDDNTNVSVTFPRSPSGPTLERQLGALVNGVNSSPVNEDESLPQSPKLSLLTGNSMENGEDAARARLLLDDVRGTASEDALESVVRRVEQQLGGGTGRQTPLSTHPRTVRFEDDVNAEHDDTWAVGNAVDLPSENTNPSYIGMQSPPSRRRATPSRSSFVWRRDSSHHKLPRQQSDMGRAYHVTHPESPRASMPHCSPASGAVRAVSTIPLRVRHLFNPRPEKWGTGISPSLLYLPDEQFTKDKGALRPTKLAAISASEDKRNLVVRGKSFTVRVVGSFLPFGMARRRSTRVLYSGTQLASWNEEENSVKSNQVHTVRAGFNFAYAQQYQVVSNNHSLVVDASGSDKDGGMEVRGITIRAVMGETGRNAVSSESGVTALESALGDGTVFVDGEIAWEVVPDEGDMRIGSIPLRFGYYCILGRPCDSRLYYAAQTPENLRLVALAEPVGRVQMRDVSKRREMLSVTKSLPYVVIRVSEA